MIPISIRQLISTINGKFIGKKFDNADFAGNFSIDTRTLKNDDIFIAIIGERFDGNDFIEEAFKDEPKVRVISYEGLTIELCKKEKAEFILRGLRNPADFEFEKAIAHTNRRLSKIETVFLLTAAKTSFISSSIVRDVIRHNGEYEILVPEAVRVRK